MSQCLIVTMPETHGCSVLAVDLLTGDVFAQWRLTGVVRCHKAVGYGAFVAYAQSRNGSIAGQFATAKAIPEGAVVAPADLPPAVAEARDLYHQKRFGTLTVQRSTRAMFG